MKCPFCKEEMKIGTISQDRYALKWVPEESDKGLLNFTPFIKGIKLTSMSNLTVKVFHCQLPRPIKGTGLAKGLIPLYLSEVCNSCTWS